jgi:hypothetical protein
MNEIDTDRGRRTEGPITVTVRRATPDNKWDYPHVRVDAEKDGPGAVTTLMCELSPENVRQLHGSDKDGISTSTAVWAMIQDALRDYGIEDIEAFVGVDL